MKIFGTHLGQESLSVWTGTPLSRLCSICVIFVLLGAAIMVSPISWSEIFLITTLKNIAGETSIQEALTLKWAAGGSIALSTAQHDPPWQLLLLSKISNALPVGWDTSNLVLGGREQIAARCVAISLAGVLFIPLLRWLQASSTVVWVKDKSFLESAVAVLLLFVLTRHTALQQLVALISLIPFSQLSHFESKLNTERRRSLGMLCLGAILLVLSGSKTWIPVITLSALIYGCVVVRKLNWFSRRFGPAIVVGGVFFWVQHASITSYQGLVHHFTIRWLYDVTMVTTDWSWTGSSTIWKAAAAGFSVLALRSVYSKNHRTYAQPLQYLVGLIIAVAGLWICINQQNPLFEDICVQAFLLCLLRISLQNQRPSPFNALPFHSLTESPIIQKAARALLIVFWVSLIALPLLLIALAFVPGSTVLAELDAWIAASRIAFKDEFAQVVWATFFGFSLFFILNRMSLARMKALFLTSLLLLFYVINVIRGHSLWEQHRQLSSLIPAAHRILYFSSIEPFITIDRSPHPSSMVVINRNTDAPQPFSTQVSLLLPTHASDLCQAMNWRIERKHGIFTLCAMTQDSLWKLFPLN